MSDFPLSRSRQSVRPTMMALGAAIVVVVFWTIGVSIQQKVVGAVTSADLGAHLTRNLGLALGVSLAGAFVVWAVLFFAFVRRVAPARGAIHLGVLAAVAVLLAAPASALKVLGAAEAHENAAIRRIETATLARVDAHLQGVDEARDRILADGFMEPAALARPGGIARARRQVEELRALVKGSEVEAVRLRDQARAELEALDMSEGRRRTAIRGFDEGYAKARKAGEEDVAMAMSVFDEMDAQLDVLARTPRAWQIQFGMIAFSRQKDLNDFNGHVLRSQELGRELENRQRLREYESR